MFLIVTSSSLKFKNANAQEAWKKVRSLKWHNKLIYAKNGSPTFLYTNASIGEDKELPECWEKEIKDRLKPNCSIWTDYLRGEGKCGSDFIAASLPHCDNMLHSYTSTEMWDQILQWKQACTWGRQNISNLSWICTLKSLMSIVKVTRNTGTASDTIL